MRIRVRFHTSLDLCDVWGVIQIDSLQAQGTTEKMDVTVRESGQHELAACVDLFSRGSAIVIDLSRAAYGHNLVAANGDGFGPGLLCVDGVDAPMSDQEIRRRLRLRPCQVT